MERAFCDTSSATTNLKDRGVAVELAAAKADIMEPTAKMAITNMLLESVLSKSSSDSYLMSGAMTVRKVPSANSATSAPMMERMQNIKGLNQSFSESVLK